MIPPEIKTIIKGAETRIKEKGSVFITNVFNVKNLDDVQNSLKSVKKKYFDATHHCYAYRFSDGTYKSSDDGEPAGTAGLRIMNAIDHFQLTNLIVIVTRYFGGTKLGVGPLGNAYYSSAENSLSLLEKITQISYVLIEVKIPFDYVSQMHKILGDTSSRLLNTEYSENVKFKCLVVPANIESFQKKITEFTSGIAEIKLTNEYYLI